VVTGRARDASEPVPALSSSLLAVMSNDKLPDFQAGVAYWANTEATVNGVLGGYGESTSVPRLDATASRLLLLALIPGLSTIVPPHHAPPSSSSSQTPKRSYRALDCGAGIGRVTSTALVSPLLLFLCLPQPLAHHLMLAVQLPLFHRVDLVEPVSKFLQEAKRNAEKGKEGWKTLSTGKGVRMWLAGLQYFDPSAPAIPVPPLVEGSESGTTELFATMGNECLDWPDPKEKIAPEDGYDVVMIQWCIGHLSDAELVEFLKRSRKALREGENGVEGYIVLKENVCKDTDGEGAGTLFDDDDSSVTRYALCHIAERRSAN
jgi:protein N-terminal methyltransferase